jgi:hypothetical protein
MALQIMVPPGRLSRADSFLQIARIGSIKPIGPNFLTLNWIPYDLFFDSAILSSRLMPVFPAYNSIRYATFQPQHYCPLGRLREPHRLAIGCMTRRFFSMTVVSGTMSFRRCYQCDSLCRCLCRTPLIPAHQFQMCVIDGLRNPPDDDSWFIPSEFRGMESSISVLGIFRHHQ